VNGEQATTFSELLLNPFLRLFPSAVKVEFEEFLFETWQYQLVLYTHVSCLKGEDKRKHLCTPGLSTPSVRGAPNEGNYEFIIIKLTAPFCSDNFKIQ